MREKPAACGGRPVRKSFLVFGRPHIMRPEIDEVVRTLESGWISTGPKVEKFERMFKSYIGSKYAVALNSCTAGLYLALKTMGIGRGHEVITSSISFAATANVIVHSGARPVFADVDLDSMNISPRDIERKITKRTKAIIPVHIAGRPCEMDRVMAIARKRKVGVIEDAAHAVEARFKGRKIGNIGDITAFSFYATKNIATGEGGMITTNNRKWAEKARILSLHGISKSAWTRYTEKGFRPYDILYPGYKFNMMDIQAAMGIHHLARIEKNLKVRERHFKKYNSAFKDIPELCIFSEDKRIKHARHLYIILIRPELLRIGRNHFIAALMRENIGSGIHFSAIHLSDFYRRAFGCRRGSLPNAEFISDRTVSLPLSPALSDKDVNDVIRAVRKIVEYYRK